MNVGTNSLRRIALTATFAASLAVPAYALKYYAGCKNCPDGRQLCASAFCSGGASMTCYCNGWVNGHYTGCAATMVCQ